MNISPEKRNDIIERFITIENLINNIIMNHYFKKGPKRDFHFEVLYDEHFHFGLRRSILEKIIYKIYDDEIRSDSRKKKFHKNKIEILYKLNKTRNYFAHISPNIITIRDNQEIDNVALDPRKLKEEIDFEELYDEFIEGYDEVTKYLVGILGTM